MERRVVSGITLALLLALALNISRVQGPSETVLRVDPSTTEVSVGSDFTNNISVADVAALFGFQFRLGYNTTILDALAVSIKPSFEGSYQINDPEGYVYVEGWLPIGYPPLYGSFPLASINFKAVSLGGSQLHLFETNLLDPMLNPIPHITLDGSVIVSPKTIVVPDDFLTIQDAINAANPRDTIFVRNGTYNENIVVNKTVSLIGEDRVNTTINGYYRYMTSVATLTVDDVLIRGFTIQNDWCGIAVSSSSGCLITENRIVNNTYRGGGPQIIESGRGVWLTDSQNCTVARNIIDGNDRNVSLRGAYNNTIMENTITNSLASWGIILEDSHSNSIRGNVVEHSRYDGIYLAGADSNNISANSVVDNGDEGIYVSGSDNTIDSNTIEDNSGEGIWIDWSSNSTITQNTLRNNKKRGVLAWHSASTIVYHNNFINNSWDQAYSDLLNTWDNGYPFGGNYWSDYHGADQFAGPYQNATGSDGIGDTPYVFAENNTDRYPLIYPYGHVPTPDINNDGVVDMFDLIRIALTYGSTPGIPIWNPYCDINKDEVIDVFDLIRVAIHFGERYP